MNQFRASSLRSTPPGATERAIQRLVRATIPRLADFTLAYVVQGTVIGCIAAAHRTRTGTRLVRTLGRVHHVKRSDAASSVAQVVRSGSPLLRVAIHMERAAAAARADGDVLELHRQLAPRSALVVPIVSGRAVLGALSLCYSESGRAYTPQDIPAASQVAGRIGRLLCGPALGHATLRLRAPARDARQGTTFRRRVASRD